MSSVSRSTSCRCVVSAACGAAARCLRASCVLLACFLRASCVLRNIRLLTLLAARCACGPLTPQGLESRDDAAAYLQQLGHRREMTTMPAAEQTEQMNDDQVRTAPHQTVALAARCALHRRPHWFPCTHASVDTRRVCFR